MQLKPVLENRLGLQWHESTIDKNLLLATKLYTGKLAPTTRKQSTQLARKFVIVCHIIRPDVKDDLKSCKSGGGVVKCKNQKHKQTSERQCLSS